MSKCIYCGALGGAHLDTCSAVIARAKATASQKQRGDALMEQLEGTLMGKLRQTEAERDALLAENKLLREHASQRVLDMLDGPRVCPVCHGQGGDLEDSSKPCYECGR